MSEEKLTVAELLARRQKEGNASELPRRRRRRSLEEGGVSVQELTGSIPRVKAGEPHRGAHALSNSDDDQTKASDLLADETANATADEAAVTEAEAAVSNSAEASAEAAVEAAAAAETDQPKAAEEAEETDAAAAGTAAAAAAGTSTAVERKAPGEMEEAAKAAKARAHLMPPMAVPLEPRPVMVNSERSEITYTFTDLRDAHDDSRVVGEPGPAAKAALTGSNSYDDRPTATIPAITDEVAAEHAAKAKAEEDKVAEFPAESTESTESVELTEPEAAEHEAQEESVPFVTPAVSEEAALAEDPVEAPSAPTTAEFEATDAEEPETQREVNEVADELATEDVVKHGAVGTADAAQTDAAKADDNYAEDNSLSVPLLLVQVFVGLIAGALVFLGFTMAWSALPTVVVVIMALVATLLLAGAANYVRRKKDTLTPILAGLVGLALTFGPWLIFQL